MKKEITVTFANAYAAVLPFVRKAWEKALTVENIAVKEDVVELNRLLTRAERIAEAYRIVGLNVRLEGTEHFKGHYTLPNVLSIRSLDEYDSIAFPVEDWRKEYAAN